jgi:hypothetical protein
MFLARAVAPVAWGADTAVDLRAAARSSRRCAVAMGGGEAWVECMLAKSPEERGSLAVAPAGDAERVTSCVGAAAVDLRAAARSSRRCAVAMAGGEAWVVECMLEVARAVAPFAWGADRVTEDVAVADFRDPKSTSSMDFPDHNWERAHDFFEAGSLDGGKLA